MREHTALIEQIALYLGKPWKFNRLQQESCWQRSIVDGTGRAILISKPYGSQQRFEISGSFPRQITQSYHSDYQKIGVSYTRPAKDIAADITRRLLPHYLSAFETAKQRYLDNQKQQETLDLMAQALVKVTDGRILSHHGNNKRDIYFTNGQAEIYRGDNRIKLVLTNLSADQAIKIAASVCSAREPP